MVYMIAYAIILFVLAAILFIWGCLLYKGNLNSMRANHQRMVKNKVSYGKAMGKALFVMSLSQVLAGVIALLGERTAFVLITLVVSVAGMILGIYCINKVQEKLINGEF
jgi:hypothetical protein